MDQQMALGAPLEAPQAKLTFMEGLLASWFESAAGRPPKKKERLVLSAAAEQCLVAFQALVLAEGKE